MEIPNNELWTYVKIQRERGTRVSRKEKGYPVSCKTTESVKYMLN